MSKQILDIWQEGVYIEIEIFKYLLRTNNEDRQIKSHSIEY